MGEPAAIPNPGEDHRPIPTDIIPGIDPDPTEDEADFEVGWRTSGEGGFGLVLWEDRPLAIGSSSPWSRGREVDLPIPSSWGDLRRPGGARAEKCEIVRHPPTIAGSP